MISRPEFERKASRQLALDRSLTTEESIDRLTMKVQRYRELCHQRRQTWSEDQIGRATVEVVFGIYWSECQEAGQ